MFEVVYGGAETRKLVEDSFPSAIVNDASDDIHEERFSVDGVDEEQFYAFALEKGFAPMCLGFCVMLNAGKMSPRLKKIWDERVSRMKVNRDEQEK